MKPTGAATQVEPSGRSRPQGRAEARPVQLVQDRSSAATRGFSLPELLAVITIIAILGALAIPSFVSNMRDRRINQAAQQIAQVYRTARARAMGRGTAVNVRWDGTSVEAKEAILGSAATAVNQTAACQPLPSPACTSSATNWAAGSATSQSVQIFRKDPLLYESIEVVGTLPGGTAGTFDVCFSPRGRTFFNANIGTPVWSTLTGVPQFDVTNTSNSRVRTVLVVPNGIARLVL